MEFGDVVRRRRMVRRFRADRAVPADVRDSLLQAAVRVPSAGFSQGVSFVVAEKTSDRERFWAATSNPTSDSPNRWLAGMRSAPLLIMVWTSESAYRRRYSEADKRGNDEAGRRDESWAAPFWYVDAGMAVLAALYAVVDADDDLGACFFGVPIDRVGELRDAFAVPEDQLAVGVIAVGYRAADETPSGSAASRSRKPVDQVVHLGRW